MIKLKIKDKSVPAKEVKEEPFKKPRIKIKKPVTHKPAPEAKSLSTKIKLVKRPPKIKLKAKRVPGDGYDSEDPDKEDDPLIEEGIVLRVLPDESLDNLKYMVETGDLSDLNIKWKDSKRAIVSIKGQKYGAKLIDLPTITEVMKTIDRKNIFKTLDVCQMLLVVKKLQDEREINDIKIYEYESYPNGLTKPLKGVKQRFSKRINNLIINKVELRVEQLLKLDAELENSKYELVDFDQTPSTTTVNTPRAMNDADIPGFTSVNNNDVVREMIVNDGEDDEMGIDLDELGDQITDDLEQELAQALGSSGDEEEDDDDDDDDDEDDDDDDDEGEVRAKEFVGDNEQEDENQHNEMIKEEILELEATIRQKENDVSKLSNPILRNRFMDIINRLKQELSIKMQQLKNADGDNDNDEFESNTALDEQDEEEEDDEEDEEEDEEDEEEDGDDNEDGDLFGLDDDDQKQGGNEDDDDDMEGLF